MLVVILVYDQVLFRPLVAWADRFRVEQEAGGAAPTQSWVLTVLRRSPLAAWLAAPAGAAMRWSYRVLPEIGRAHAELQSLMRLSYAVFCLKKQNKIKTRSQSTPTLP